MKFLKYVSVIAALTVVMHLEAHAQTNELESFLGKFETYAETHYPKTKWTMPIAKPKSGSNSMLEAKVEGFMQDPETGLRHYPRRSEVYDPATGYYIEYDPEAKYHVDTKAGKIYKGKTEIKVKNKKTK